MNDHTTSGIRRLTFDGRPQQFAAAVKDFKLNVDHGQFVFDVLDHWPMSDAEWGDVQFGPVDGMSMPRDKRVYDPHEVYIVIRRDKETDSMLISALGDTQTYVTAQSPQWKAYASLWDTLVEFINLPKSSGDRQQKTKREHGGFVLPREERRKLVEKFRRERSAGKIDNVAAWAKRNGSSARSLSRYRKEFPRDE